MDKEFFPFYGQNFTVKIFRVDKNFSLLQKNMISLR